MKVRPFYSPFLKHKKRIFSVMYSWGAAIILSGVLFKLTNLPYATEMLFIGMISEIIVFFFSAFESIDKKDATPIRKEIPSQIVKDIHVDIVQLNHNIQQLSILVEELIRKEHSAIVVNKDAEANSEKMILALAEMNKNYLNILRIQDRVMSEQQTCTNRKYDE